MNIVKEEGKRKNNKLALIIIIVAIIIIGIVIMYFLKFKDDSKETNSSELNKINVYSKNTNQSSEWNNYDTIVIESGSIDAELYSFDGGLNWQESNEFTTTTNGRFNIVIKDKNGQKINVMTYTVSSIDNTAPVITVNLPAKIAQNETIDLKEYVTATDDLSGIDGEIAITPEELDTTTLGTRMINYTTKDKAGNETSINISVEIVEPTQGAETETPDNNNQDNTNQDENKKDNNSNSNSNSNSNNSSSNTQYITLYRYRVKKSNTYTCKTYDCSYYSDTTEPTKTYTSTGKCNESYNEKITFKNGCTIIPTQSGVNCTQAITTVDRYKLIDDKYVDIIALSKNGTQIKYSSTIGSLKKESSNSGTSTESSTIGSEYKQTPCDKNEVAINGYCHAVCSTPTLTCPTGYQLTDGTCKKYVSKTCTDTCTNYTWSSWSKWSETKVIASNEIQVETKIVQK